jgi:Asp-tRNA(Asn)/Glu-tRNA(Gln) amidotransferase A subunit family amidase
MLSIVSGPTEPPTGPHILPNCDVDYLGALNQGVEDYSIAYSPDLGVYPVDDRTQRVVEANVDAISEAGATVEQVDVDLGVTYNELIAGLRDMWGMLYVTIPEALDQYGVDPLGDDRDKFPDEFINFIEYGRDDLTTVELKRNDETLRTSVLNGIQAVFEDYDLLVTPTVSVPPFPNDLVGPTEIDGVETEPILGWLITAVFNMTGNPAASIPAGFTSDRGLPVGMQVVGPLLGDQEVIAACAEYERVNPWHDEYPGVQQSQSN